MLAYANLIPAAFWNTQCDIFVGIAAIEKVKTYENFNWTLEFN